MTLDHLFYSLFILSIHLLFIHLQSLQSIMASDVDTFVRDDRLFVVLGSLSNASNDCFEDNMPRVLDGVNITDADGIISLLPGRGEKDSLSNV